MIGWTNEQFPDGILEPAWKTVVYSTHGAIEVNVMKRRCVNLACYRSYDGCEDSLFLLSKSIAVGYELGWEYVEGVLRNKMTFSGFTKGVQDRYSRFTSPCNFMAANTFIRWWFAWASAMRINFVKQCFSCGNDIKILACDGTKIGYTLKQANVRPIESPDDPTGLVYPTTSRRFDRTLITNSIDSVGRKAINAQLTSLANNVLNETVIENDQMHFIMTENTNIPIEIKQLIFHMCQCPTINVIERKSVASLLILILKESSITNIIPRKYMNATKEMVSLVKSNATNQYIVDTFIQTSKFFCPELGDLILVSSRLAENQKPKQYVTDFLTYFIMRIDKIHELNIPPAEISDVRKYNPPRDGKAYYFSEKGHQLRNVRLFEIDQTTAVTANFDTKPDELCNKSYNSYVSKKGATYLFLWFCPAHGHCYGFHVIPGSEGRKDPANSLYTFLEKAPEVIYYDFACSFSEYTKNRESGYYENTRFFHDIFHGYSHKCSSIFKSNRILGFKGVNTSICEQFNSYIQCIKASCKLMTQEHYTFYLQFFIHQWNNKKKEPFLKNLKTAIAGYQ